MARVWEGWRGASEKEVLKRETDGREEKMYVDLKSDGDRFGKEEIEKTEEMSLNICGKIYVCDDRLGEKNLFAITDDTLLTIGGKKSKGEGRWRRWGR